MLGETEVCCATLECESGTVDILQDGWTFGTPAKHTIQMHYALFNCLSIYIHCLSQSLWDFLA